MKQPVYLFGRNPLTEAILSLRRNQPNAIEKLYLTKASEEDPKIMSMVQSAKLTYSVVTAQEIESMVGKDSVHQGVCALINENALYTPMAKALERALKKSEESGKNALFVLLDELQDPHNVGAIIRSAVAFGATAILLPEYNQTQITGTVIKTASGMNFAIPVVRIGNINTTLRELKDKGFWTYALTGDGDTLLHKAKFDTNTVLVVGSEGEGIRTKTLEVCDFRLSIETNPLCESLNASNAASVSMYAFSIQQGQ